MLKTSTILIEKNSYEINTIIGDIALINSVTNQSALLNIKTNEIVANFGDFHTTYDSMEKMFFQESEADPDSLNDISDNQKYLRIYDALNNKCILDGWLVIYEYSSYELTILQSPNGKYHIFEKNNFRNPKNIFNEEFDNIEIIKTGYHSKLIVSKNGKYGLYETKNGFIKLIKYDNIEFINNITIFTKNNEKFFTISDFNWKSPVFEKMKFDKNYNKILYGINDTNISVYSMIEYGPILFTTKDFDDIKYISHIIKKDGFRKYFFVTLKDGKYGIISGMIDTYVKHNELNNYEILANSEYDEISHDNEFLQNEYDDIHEIFYLKKNGKMGVAYSNNTQNHYISPKYDKIVKYKNGYYAFYIGDYCDIIHLYNPNKPSITNCKIIDCYNDTIIYKKNEKYGFFSIEKTKKNSTAYNSYGYKSITNYKNGYYKVQFENGKFGIYDNYSKKIIIKPVYNSIELYTYNCNKTYFALKDKSNKVKLVSCDYIPFNKKITDFNSTIYDSIYFFPDIFVTNSEKATQIYSPKGKLLKTFEKNTVVEPIIDNKNTLYFVNNKYYFYKDENFEEAQIADNELYTTVYECKYGTIVVNNYNRKKHNKICREIELQGEAIIDKKLLNYYNSHPNLQEKYPKLIKK